MARIKDRQFRFFEKVKELTPDEAIVSSIMSMCQDSSIIRYYTNLEGDCSKRDMEERERRIQESNSSMCIYYNNMNFHQKSCIYNSMANDYHRFIITRWRLSNHDLKIETGRYTRPITPREERLCGLCGVIEDEYHAVFVCPRYDELRIGHESILGCNNISTFLDCNTTDIGETASLLHKIEKKRKDTR